MMLPISYPSYLDRVLAGWNGKSLGGTIGAPLENQKGWLNISTDTLWPEKLAPNDDLDIQIVWLECLQERGVHITHDDLADYWQDRCHYNFCEYGFFLHNIQRGIRPPLSGWWNNSFFRESEGCPIRAEVWGYVAPGAPELAAELARLDAELDHSGASVRVERFLAAASSMAIVSDSLDICLDAGCAVIPPDCPEAKAVNIVRDICERYPEPYDAWRLVIRRYGDRDASKAITNHALTLMALFLGGDDFCKVIHICANAGWDTDCTAATAGALFGALRGMDSLPSDWLSKLGPNLVTGIRVPHDGAPIAQFAEETCRVGVEMIASRGLDITFSDAPALEVRAAPEPAPKIVVEYVDEPVLWNDAASSVVIRIHNPLGTELAGELAIDSPDGILCKIESASLVVPAGTTAETTVTIRRQTSGAWIADKNLFSATFTVNDTEVASREFGLGGARQWLIYGPYWDMWDRRLASVCPFNNERIRCTPGGAGIMSDTYNQHVRSDHAYLNEAHLALQDIPEELPFHIERGEDRIDAEHLGGFLGQACYYFVRTVRWRGEPRNARLHIGRTGPITVCFDGRPIYGCADIRCWCENDFAGNVSLTGEPQRLVIKLSRLTDALTLSSLFIGGGDPEGKRGISYILDEIEDLPPTLGV